MNTAQLASLSAGLRSPPPPPEVPVVEVGEADGDLDNSIAEVNASKICWSGRW